MKPISIELVPRSIESLTKDLQVLQQQFPSVDMVNIPDLLRFDVRSWDACQLAQISQSRTIPHIRAMDYPQKDAEKLCAILADRGLDEIGPQILPLLAPGNDLSAFFLCLLESLEHVVDGRRVHQRPHQNSFL